MPPTKLLFIWIMIICFVCSNSQSFTYHNVTLICNGNEDCGGSGLGFQYHIFGNSTIICSGDWSCKDTKFYYYDKQLKTHICTGNKKACEGAGIYSSSPISLQCNSTSCNDLDIIWPTNNESSAQSTLTITGTANPFINIYSVYGPMKESLSCNGDSTCLDKVRIIYGITFDNICLASLWGTNCTNDYKDDRDLFLVDPSSDNYRSNNDYSEFILGSSEDALFILEGSYTNFIPPVINNNSSYLSILAVNERLQYSGTFNLSSVPNAVITNAMYYGLVSPVVYGGTKTFQFNSYRAAYSGTFYLENTERVILNSIMSSSSTYLGDTINVEITCGGGDFMSCSSSANVYSSVDPVNNAVFQSLFNVYCLKNKYSGSCGCYSPKFHFTSINTTCTHDCNGPSCGFWTTAPTNAPTDTPTNAPSNSPSNAPTYSPSFAPSNDPTDAPSFSPSYSPTNVPSFSPTRYPTLQNEYDKTMILIYEIKELSQINVLSIKNNLDNIINDIIIPILEDSYIIVSKIYSSDLEYREFTMSINHSYIEEKADEDGSIMMPSVIHYKQNDVQTIIEFISDKPELFNYTISALRETLNNNLLRVVSVYTPDPTLFPTPTPSNINIVEEEDKLMLYALLIFIGIMAFGSFVAFIFNKIPYTKIDDATYTVLTVFGLQIFDFVSDINLSIEMMLLLFDHNNNDNKDNKDNILLLFIAAIGSVIG